MIQHTKFVRKSLVLQSGEWYLSFLFTASLWGPYSSLCIWICRCFGSASFRFLGYKNVHGKSIVTKLVEVGYVKIHRVFVLVKLLENHRIALL